MTLTTIREQIIAARKLLTESRVEDAAFNADCLAAHVLGITNGQLPQLWNQPADDSFVRSFQQLLERRCCSEPLQYLLGEWSFLDFDVRVAPGALIPRPETEEVFMAAAAEIARRPFAANFSFADVGTGTGILAIAMARKFAGASGFMLDVSPAALQIAAANRQRFPEIAARLELRQNDLLSGFAPDSLDVVISNPPYIESAEVPILQAEVSRFEPHLALDGGKDGLELIDRLLKQAISVIKPGGLLIFEHGHGQRQRLNEMLNSHWRVIAAADDLHGCERYFILEKGRKEPQ